MPLLSQGHATDQSILRCLLKSVSSVCLLWWYRCDVTHLQCLKAYACCLWLNAKVYAVRCINAACDSTELRCSLSEMYL